MTETIKNNHASNAESIRNIKEAYDSGRIDGEGVQAAIEELSAKRIEEILTSKTSVEVKGKKYYVANDGNDTNDGLTPETAWQTPERVDRCFEEQTLLPGDGVFFKRGEIFRGEFRAAPGVTYSAFG